MPLHSGLWPSDQYISAGNRSNIVVHNVSVLAHALDRMTGQIARQLTDIDGEIRVAIRMISHVSSPPCDQESGRYPSLSGRILHRPHFACAHSVSDGLLMLPGGALPPARLWLGCLFWVGLWLILRPHGGGGPYNRRWSQL